VARTIKKSPHILYRTNKEKTINNHYEIQNNLTSTKKIYDLETIDLKYNGNYIKRKYQIYWRKRPMDLRKMNSFLEYTPVFDENPTFIIEDILEKARKYLGEEHLKEIYKAYEFAHKAHKGIKRLSGEPYIIHPLRATQFLMEINPDLESIQACILHDVIEDTPVEHKDIEKEF
jgi:hypothetical protein